MMEEILVVRGVYDFDDLKRWGLPIAKKVADADVVIAIEPSGIARALKSREQMHVEFLDGDSHMSEVAQVIGRVKASYQEMHSDNAHLAHAFTGMWLFYWVGGFGEEIQPLPIEMIAAGDVERLRESAQQYIDADFGNRAGNMVADGEPDSSPA